MNELRSLTASWKTKIVKILNSFVSVTAAASLAQTTRFVAHAVARDGEDEKTVPTETVQCTLGGSEEG